MARPRRRRPRRRGDPRRSIGGGRALRTTALLPRGRNLAAVALPLVGVVGVAVYAGLGWAASTRLSSRGWWSLLGVGCLLLLAGVLLAPRVERRRAVLIVCAVGIACRAVLVPLPPALSSDMYRYLWDGRVQAAGINPYIHPPAAGELVPLRDEAVFERMNRPRAHTIYPPVAQGVFRAAHAVGLRTTTGWKALLVVAEALALALLVTTLRRAGRDERTVVAYAWNPLPILATGLSGHLDGLVVVAVLAAVLAWQRSSAVGVGAALGLAAGVKLFPLGFVVAFARPPDGGWRWPFALRAGGVAAGLLALSYLPFLSAGTGVLGFLTTGYLDETGYGERRRYVLADALGLDGRLVVPVLAVAIGLAVLRSRAPAPRRAAWLLGGALALTTPFGWYAMPLVALAVAGGAGWLWPWFAIALHAAYLTVFHGWVFEGLGVDALSRWIRLIAAGAIAVLVVASWRVPWARRAVLAEPAPGTRPRAEAEVGG